MRADVLIGAYRSGDATGDHTSEIVRLLLERGMEPQVWCNLWQRDVPADILPRVRMSDYADYRPGAALTLLEYPLWFPLAEQFRNVGGTRIFWYHGVTPPEFGEQERAAIFRLGQLRTDLAWHAHLAVTDSPFTIDELHRNSGYPRERIRTVPIGVRLDAFARRPTGAELAELRARWGLTEKRVLLYVGRIAANKGLDLLVDALGQLSDAYPDLRLLIVGDTGQGSTAQMLVGQLKAQAARLGLANSLIFTGRVPEIGPYLALADVMALPSRHEGFGVPLVEAMAAGVPVVGSTAGAIPWVLGALDEPDAAAGLLFPADEADALAAQIRRLLDEPELRGAMIERGQRRADYFSLAAFRKRAQALIDEANELARQGPPPIETRSHQRLFRLADVALRGHRVTSRLPVIGRAVAWLRRNSTTHLKEVYFDPIIERQINYNRLAALVLHDLEQAIVTKKESRKHDNDVW